MKTKITSLALLINSFIFAQNSNTQIRNNAGESTTQSGFYQTQNPQNYPNGANSWWGLIDLRHSESSSTNNYGIQIAGSFFNQELWLRKNNNSSQQWSKFVLENTDGNVGIGTSNPQARLDVQGNIRVGDNSNFFSYNGAADIQLKYSARGSGGRAIVHEDNNILVINYSGDFTGGTKIANNVFFKNNGDTSFQGKIEAKEIKVTLTPTADFVFEENYDLPKLKDVEKFIKENKHLPEVASAKTMEKEGVNIGEFQIKMLQKIEELTLYVIDQQKKIETLENKLSSQK